MVVLAVASAVLALAAVGQAIRTGVRYGDWNAVKTVVGIAVVVALLWLWVTIGNDPT